MATREVGTDHPIRCRINGLALFAYGRNTKVFTYAGVRCQSFRREEFSDRLMNLQLDGS